MVRRPGCRKFDVDAAHLMQLTCFRAHASEQRYCKRARAQSRHSHTVSSESEPPGTPPQTHHGRWASHRHLTSSESDRTLGRTGTTLRQAESVAEAHVHVPNEAEATQRIEAAGAPWKCRAAGLGAVRSMQTAMQQGSIATRQEVATSAERLLMSCSVGWLVRGQP
jgi:hypothetical protein